MFYKILIANRGEIAVRIEATCREMGITTVAVYSEVDANALHVQFADEAFLVGPAPALESYLSIEAILEAARSSQAQAVHPGYGFLAENPRFASAVRDAGLVWIGPPAEVIERLGDKVAAKELAMAASVPVVPGYAGEDQSPGRIASEAEKTGYPVMLKAAAGGGGKGMRAVRDPSELNGALEGARREAHSAFGDDRVFLEKLILNPRHVEIQVLLDSHGAGVYLGERDCSIQRRHQKVVEEAPSPVVSADLRRAMGEDALSLCRAAGYVNAGTVEFLFSGDRYYFLEVNTRIQVEHPVTEAITGLDLVRLQLMIAAGEPLTLSQNDVILDGHAFEARLYAEDPEQGFVPSTGKVSRFKPPEGPGIRNDVGVYEGSDVSPYYDPMLAKLIVHGVDRKQSLARLRDALDRYVLSGPTTNLSFLRSLVRAPLFVEGRAGVDFLDRQWRPGERTEVSLEVASAAALVQVLLPYRHPSSEGGTDPFSPWQSRAGWRALGFARTFAFRVGDEDVEVELMREGGTIWMATCGEQTTRLEATVGGPNVLLLRFSHRVERFEVTRSEGGLLLERRGESYPVRFREATEHLGPRVRGDRSGGATTPMPGTVVNVTAQQGQRVKAHQPLVVLEAMKMEHVIEAPYDGVVTEVLVQVGDMVAAGSSVVEIEAE